ncbi:MAG: hypothetical protein ACR2GZ_01360 [Solirubrobacteraceae bacterium]
MIYTGNGRPGPFDAAVPNPLASVIEAGVHELSTLFHARLQVLGIHRAGVPRRRARDRHHGLHHSGLDPAPGLPAH